MPAIADRIRDQTDEFQERIKSELPLTLPSPPGERV